MRILAIVSLTVCLALSAPSRAQQDGAGAVNLMELNAFVAEQRARFEELQREAAQTIETIEEADAVFEELTAGYQTLIDATKDGGEVTQQIARVIELAQAEADDLAADPDPAVRELAPLFRAEVERLEGIQAEFQTEGLRALSALDALPSARRIVVARFRLGQVQAAGDVFEQQLDIFRATTDRFEELAREAESPPVPDTPVQQ